MNIGHRQRCLMALYGAVISIVGRKLNVLRSFPHPYQAHLGVFTLYRRPSEHTQI